MQFYLDYLLSYFPRRLPVGMTAHKAWAARIISLTGKLADEDSLRWALANQLIHLSPQTSTKPDQYFIRSLRKAAANQVASQVFQDIKMAQELKKQREETEAAHLKVASDDSETQKANA